MMSHCFHDTVIRVKYTAMDEFPGKEVSIEITIGDWSYG